MAGDKYKGTASCTVRKSDGSIENISLSCFGEFSYEAAKQKLEYKVRMEVSSKRGQVQGNITFNITKEW